MERAAVKAPDDKAEMGETLVSEALVDEAVALCRGDLRATVRALLAGQISMERRLQAIHSHVSAGYVRRGPPPVADTPSGS